MLEFVLGGVLVAILYTFFPSMAVIPSGWLRAAWAAISRRSPKE